MRFDLIHPADQIVMIMERIYGYGMTTTSGGNLSIKDSNGDIWITPSSIDKGSLTRNDIVRVTKDGEIIGKHKPSVELPFHKMLYEKRPDINAVLHAHPPALVSCSLVNKVPNTSLIANANQICGKVIMSEYEIPGSIILAQNITNVFDDDTTAVMMANHGVVIVHDDLFKAFMAFETLEFCARLEINALRIGKPEGLSEKYLAIEATRNHPKLETFVEKQASSEEKEIRQSMVKLIKRCYEQQLFTSTQGTFSHRIDGNNFVITPHGLDRKYLEIQDIVRIEDGKCEEGKIPSRAVLLHKEIYEQHPDVNSIIIAHPPHVTAFAVSDAEFDARTIPESYIMLRNVPKLPFGATFMQPKLFAKELSLNKPVALVENDSVITLGTSLINAFDRLEVAEYTAKSIIDAMLIGEIGLITDKQVEDIDKAFNLGYDD